MTKALPRPTVIKNGEHGRSVVFNGRFLKSPQSGVQRVAGRLILAVDEMLSGRADPANVSVFTPPGAPALPLRAILSKTIGRRGGQIWEQMELPVAASGSALINLCNAAPLLADSHLTMIHDAQVFESPGSYSRAFSAWYRFCLPRIARRARRVLTVSNYSKNKLVEYGVAEADHIAVIPNGVDHMLQTAPDPDALARLGLAPHRYVVLFGAYQAHKNLDFALRLFAKGALGEVKLVVVGAVDWAEVKARYDLDPDPSILLAGRQTDESIRSLLESAAFMICPSTTEGFGLPPMEAMILGCPAIVSRAGALPEVCGDAALYAEVGDADGWRHAITTLWNDGPDPTRRDRARHRAGEFTWRRAAERLWTLVETPNA